MNKTKFNSISHFDFNAFDHAFNRKEENRKRNGLNEAAWKLMYTGINQSNFRPSIIGYLSSRRVIKMNKINRIIMERIISVNRGCAKFPDAYLIRTKHINKVIETVKQYTKRKQLGFENGSNRI
jgi:hypothetical protein